MAQRIKCTDPESSRELCRALLRGFVLERKHGLHRNSVDTQVKLAVLAVDYDMAAEDIEHNHPVDAHGLRKCASLILGNRRDLMYGRIPEWIRDHLQLDADFGALNETRTLQ